jgi:hypothetical protein
MELIVKDYANTRRDTLLERELVQKLRHSSEAERFQFIQELICQNSVLGLEIAKRCSLTKPSILSILNQGFETADASSIYRWLEFAIPKLGFRRVVLLLTERLETSPKTVEYALYWLPSLMPENDPRASVALENLRMLAKNSQERG